MKKRKIFLSIAILFMLFVTLGTIKAESLSDSKTTQNLYKASEDDTAFDLPFTRIVDGRINIDKEIAQLGMMIANSTVDIDAVMNSPQLIIATDTVRINADMEDVLVIGTNSVVINANVENIIIIAGDSVTVSESGNVTENLIAVTQSLKIDGNIDGNVLGSTNSTTVNGTVNGQLRLEAEALEFGENAKVNSKIVVNTTNTNLTVPEEVGEAKIDLVTDTVNNISTSQKVKNYIFNIVLALVRDLVAFAIIMLFIKKDRIEKLVAKVTPNAIVKNGFLTWAVAIGCIIFGFTIGLFMLPQLGWSAVIVGIAIMVIFTLLKNIIVGTFIANLSSKRLDNMAGKPNKILMSVTTFLMLELFETIPLFGTIVKFIVFIFAIGILVSMITGKSEDKQKETQEETETIVAK